MSDTDTAAPADAPPEGGGLDITLASGGGLRLPPLEGTPLPALGHTPFEEELAGAQDTWDHFRTAVSGAHAFARLARQTHEGPGEGERLAGLPVFLASATFAGVDRVSVATPVAGLPEQVRGAVLNVFGAYHRRNAQDLAARLRAHADRLVAALALPDADGLGAP